MRENGFGCALIVSQIELCNENAKVGFYGTNRSSHTIMNKRFYYGWPLVAKLNNVYLFATIYIDSTSTQDIFIQRLYIDSTFHSTSAGLFLCKTNIYSTSTPKVMFYETNVFIQLQQNNSLIQQNIFIQLFKFPDIDKCFSQQSSTSLPLCHPFFKNLETRCLKQHGGPWNLKG